MSSGCSSNNMKGKSLRGKVILGKAEEKKLDYFLLVTMETL